MASWQYAPFLKKQTLSRSPVWVLKNASERLGEEDPVYDRFKTAIAVLLNAPSMFNHGNVRMPAPLDRLHPGVLAALPAPLDRRHPGVLVLLPGPLDQADSITR